MSLFKRLSTTFFSRLDQVVGEIEDHDAVIEVSMKEMRKKISEARVRHARIQREKAQLQLQLDSQRQNVTRWRERAVEVATTDEDKAMTCLARAHCCEQQAGYLQNHLMRYEQTVDKLGQDIGNAQTRLDEIRQKRSLMRARQSTSEAIQATQTEEGDAMAMLENTFERWEIKLGQAEMTLDSESLADPLEHEFLQQENTDALRIELAALVNEKGEAQ
jgi:phage shock protein A